MSGSAGPSNLIKYEIRDALRKGKGVFATKDFNAGEVIVDEETVMILQEEDYSDLTVYELYHSLSQSDRARFDDLACYAKPEDIEALAEDFGTDEDMEGAMDGAKAAFIFATNGMAQKAQRAKVRYLGIDASRANHSCKPNAVFYFQSSDNHVHVRALEDIAAGTEVVVPYVSPMGTREWRKEMLADHYGFVCDCEYCTTPQELVSEDLREQLLANVRKLENIRSLAKQLGRDPDQYLVQEQMKLADFYLESVPKVPPLISAVVERLEVYLPVLEANNKLATPAARKWFPEGFRLGSICRGPEDEFVKHWKEVSNKEKYSLDSMS